VDTCDIGVNLLNKAEDRTLTAKLNADKDSLTRSPVVGNVDQITYDQINYFRIDIEKLAVEKRAYGLVFCGLALHYVKNLKNVIDQVHASLMPGGIFVFSIEHPFLTTPKNPNGFTKSVDGETDQWPVDSYFDEGERKITWLVQGVKIQHRTLSSYLTLLTGAGFEVVKMDEWGITEHKTRKYPDGVEGVISRILLMTAKKQA
jgi:SAM-dependent methyltransferase